MSTDKAAIITALLYTDGRQPGPVMRAIVDHAVDEGHAVAGFIEREEPRPGYRRCDMVLEDVASGARINISQQRGAQARGCMLDTAELSRAESLAGVALTHRPDLLVVNKFGKAEAEGAGFRPLIAAALGLDIPVLIAVPRRNLDAWRAFAGDLSAEIDIEELVADPGAAYIQLGLATAAARSAGGQPMPLRGARS